MTLSIKLQLLISLEILPIILKWVSEPTLEWSSWKVHHSGRLCTYAQSLDLAGKACQGQTL